MSVHVRKDHFTTASVPEHTLDPRDDFMTRGIGRFVEIDHTRTDERLEIAFEWRTSYWYRREMPCADKEPVVMLEEQGPIAGVYCRCDSFWFYGVVGLFPFGKGDCHTGDRRN